MLKEFTKENITMTNQIKFTLLILLALLFVQCSEDDMEPETPEEMEEPAVMEATVSFSKADGADPNLPANQDRITDNVWITRGTGGVQIFNIRAEASGEMDASPVGTRWAVGTTDDMPNLTFTTLRQAIRPQRIVGEDLVMELVEDGIFINVRFTQWSQGRTTGGGFAYTRTAL